MNSAAITNRRRSPRSAPRRGVGLTYLNDTVYKVGEHGFCGEADQAKLLRLIEADDFRTIALFRRSLFVREGSPIERRLDLEQLETLWLSSSARRIDKDKFARNGVPFEVADDSAVAILVEAERRFPGRLPLAGLQPEQLKTFADLYLKGAITLSTDARSVPAISERPRLSMLARAQIERGDERIANLEQGMVLPSAEGRRFMLLFDGERDISQLAAEAGVGVAEAMAMVGFAGANALLVA